MKPMVIKRWYNDVTDDSEIDDSDVLLLWHTYVCDFKLFFSYEHYADQVIVSWR